MGSDISNPIFLLCIYLCLLAFPHLVMQNSNSGSSIHLARYSSTRSKTYFFPLCFLNPSTNMVFPNKYPTHPSTFRKFPQNSLCKRRHGNLKQKKKKKEVALELSSKKKTQELHVSSVSRESSIKK
jgi:hypothetical protein